MANIDGSDFGGPVLGYASASRRIGSVTRADVYAADLLWLQFGQPMVRDSVLLSTDSYTVTGDDATTLTVRGVMTGDDADTYVNELWLVVGGLVVGTEYTIAVVGDVRTTAGSLLDSGSTEARCIGRRTAIDNIIASLPKAFRTTPGSRIRGLINAVGRQIDITSGTRLDLLP